MSLCDLVGQFTILCSEGKLEETGSKSVIAAVLFMTELTGAIFAFLDKKWPLLFACVLRLQCL